MASGAVCASSCSMTARPAPPGTWPTGRWWHRAVCPSGCARSKSPRGSGRICMWCSTRCLAASVTPLLDLIHAIDHWRLWGLSIRPPMRGAHEQAQGRVALLGDAAHPMLPYLAQGAGMAIEDAAELARVLAGDGPASAGRPASPNDVATRFGQYANRRWQRNAQVQARAIRNGQIFHATGPLRWGRDAAMRLLGESLLDLAWLYQGPR